MVDSWQQSENTYIIDAENGTEMARLLDLDRLATACMGGLFPDGYTPQPGAHLLDVACGPGGWVQEVTFQYPNVEVTGIDISNSMILYARAQAEVQHLTNAHFQVMDATKPLLFSDDSFDLVNLRYALGFMLPEYWPLYLSEAMRIARPGALIRLTEAEGFGITNSAAVERLTATCLQVMEKAGLIYHPLGRTVGITYMIRQYLINAGCQNVQARPFYSDYSYGTEMHQLTCQNLLTAIQLIRPNVIKMQIVTEEEFDRLYDQASEEVQRPDFLAVGYALTAWGQVPAVS